MAQRSRVVDQRSRRHAVVGRLRRSRRSRGSRRGSRSRGSSRGGSQHGRATGAARHSSLSAPQLFSQQLWQHAATAMQQNMSNKPQWWWQQQQPQLSNRSSLAQPQLGCSRRRTAARGRTAQASHTAARGTAQHDAAGAAHDGSGATAAASRNRSSAAAMAATAAAEQVEQTAGWWQQPQPHRNSRNRNRSRNRSSAPQARGSRAEQLGAAQHEAWRIRSSGRTARRLAAQQLEGNRISNCSRSGVTAAARAVADSGRSRSRSRQIQQPQPQPQPLAQPQLGAAAARLASRSAQQLGAAQHDGGTSAARLQQAGLRSSSGPHSSSGRPHSRFFHSTTERRSCRSRNSSGPACGRAIRRRSSGRIGLRVRIAAPSTSFHFIEQPLLLVVEPQAFVIPRRWPTCPRTSRRGKSVVRIRPVKPAVASLDA